MLDSSNISRGIYYKLYYVVYITNIYLKYITGGNGSYDGGRV